MRDHRALDWSEVDFDSANLLVAEPLKIIKDTSLPLYSIKPIIAAWGTHPDLPTHLIQLDTPVSVTAFFQFINEIESAVQNPQRYLGRLKASV